MLNGWISMLMIASSVALPPQAPPSLESGQELIYQGTYREEGTPSGTGSVRDFTMETRLFVLDARPGETDLAAMTVIRLAKDGLASSEESSHAKQGIPVSVRLELLRLDAKGQLQVEGRNPSGPALLAYPAPPIAQPPTLEAAIFVSPPSGRMYVGRSWQVNEPGRSSLTWKVAAVEDLRGTRSVRLVGTQQSSDWERPRADSVAWKREEIAWISPVTGYALRYERTIHRRDIDARRPTSSSALTMEFQRRLAHPGRLAEDIRREVLSAWQFHNTWMGVRAEGSRSGSRRLMTEIDKHLSSQPETPYRPAVLAVRQWTLRFQKEAGVATIPSRPNR